MQIIVCLILAAYCGFMLYTSIKLYRKDKAALEVWQQSHPDGEKVNFDKYQSLLVLAMAVLCFVLACFRDVVTPVGQDPVMYQVTYFCLGLIFITLAIEVHIHRQIWFCPDGFYFSTEAYRYRMINGFSPRKGLLVKSMKILFANGKDLDMSGQMGQAVQERWTAWKADKKEKRSRRKR